MASCSNQTMFDVFLSFRGEDTRDNFTDHLYAALKRAAIHTFRDNDEIKRGRDLEPEIVKAIENSSASIIIISENYAKSRWCLQELSLILEQNRKGNHFVLPVFYKVDPSDVRNQSRSFAIQGSNWTEVNVDKWKSALREVGNLTGMVASGPETKFIAKIVDTIHNELDVKHITIEDHLIGMETRAEDINSWLKDKHSNTNVLAICGMGGSGKTTFAQYIFKSNKHNFENSCFLEDIGKFKKKDLPGLQKQVLTDILGGKYKMMSSLADIPTMIKKVLERKNVLIVLDDIVEHDDLCSLLGTNGANTQSKIIVTTRLLDMDSWFNKSISWRCHVHKLTLLNNHESLEVLSYHAFGSKLPLEGFRDLAIELAQYCGGNPLALKVLGSSLRVSADSPTEINDIKEVWRSRLNSLSSLKGDLDSKIQGVLQKSFDSLPRPSFRELFLHIVVFFVGKDKDYVVKILEHDWNAKEGVTNLINRCLLTVSSNNKLMMHQLLQEMGRNIVREESKVPATHTRVCGDEAYRMLTNGGGSETTEGLAVDMRKLKKGTKALAIDANSLAKMHKLKLLQLNYVKFNGYYKNFTELRWLCWHGFPLATIPSGLLMSDFLVAIDMTGGSLEKFEPPMVLNSLKILNLTDSTKLVTIHKLCWLPNLETLILWDCRNLTHVSKTIRGLESLSLLNLAGCEKLWKVSLNKKLVNQQERLKALIAGEGIPEQSVLSLPHSLKFLFLDYCNLEHHNGLGVLFNGPLCCMSLRGNLFKIMPKNIDLNMLQVLSLTSCKNLKSILCLPSTLEELYTYKCRSLERVTFQSNRFRLKKFGYKGCLKLSEVQGLFKLVAIKELDDLDLGHMKWIKKYQDHEVDLVSDDITEGRIWPIQMLYEYGIRSTYIQGIHDQSMMTFKHTSATQYLSLRVPWRSKKHKIQGLNVSCLYRSSGSKDKDSWWLFTRIRNKTKGVTWIYNPTVYCKPIVEEDVMWLSYWPIGNMLNVGDEINVYIHVMKGMIVSECVASFVFMDRDQVEQVEKRENKTMKMEEVIGGDLSEFQLSTGVYYLCRRDFFKSSNPDLIKRWFGDSIPYTELQGWKKSHESQHLDASCMELEYIEEQNSDTFYKGIFLGYFNSESNILEIKKVVSRLEGVDFVHYETEDKILYVLGYVDSMVVETSVKEFEKTVEIITVDYNIKRPKRYRMRHFMRRLRSGR